MCNIDPDTLACCNASYVFQQSFAPAVVCSQNASDVVTYAAIFGVLESLLLLVASVRAFNAPVKYILAVITIATALVDDIVVYTQFRQTIPSQVFLVLWTCLVTSSNRDGFLFFIFPLVTIPVAIVATAVRGTVVYISVAFFASKIGDKKLYPYADILFVCAAILFVDLIAVSETGTDQAEIVLSAFKLLVGIMMIFPREWLKYISHKLKYSKNVRDKKDTTMGNSPGSIIFE